MRMPELNRKLVLERRERVADGAGGYAESWLPVGELWAELRAGSGRERGGEAVTLSTATWRIIVRGAPFGAPSRPTADQRFREGARVFRILAVTERDPGGRFLTCFAREEAVA